MCREIVHERHGVVALGIVREEHSDFARRYKIRQVLDCGVIGAELLEVSLVKLAPPVRVMAKPSPESGARGDVLQPHVDAGMLLRDMGSWSFIIVQSAILIVWIIANLVGAIRGWDPYPFILLNLALSFQAAYAAPIIMMSQNRQQDIDRKAAEKDYRINVKAELEIELLHEKIDQLREREVLKLTEAVMVLTELQQQSASHARESDSKVGWP